MNEHWSLGKCPNCNKCVLIKLENGITSCYPYALPSPTDERIPKEIKKDMQFKFVDNADQVLDLAMVA